MNTKKSKSNSELTYSRAKYKAV